MVRRVNAAFRFGGGSINGNGHLSAAAFLRPGLVPFVGEEMFQCRQQERTEPAAVAVHAGELIFFQQPREKFLGQILRVVRIMSLPPHKSVNRKPVGAAELFQRIASVRGFIAPGGNHERPMRGDKRRPRRRFAVSRSGLWSGLT